METSRGEGKTGKRVNGCAGQVRRLFPTPGCGDCNPFVLLDEFVVYPGGGFTDHPHRGFEAIVYMLSGSFHYRDITGNCSSVATGGVLRFSAGRGMVHAERPGNAPLNHGLQLWVSLPPKHKRTPPEYQQVDAELIPLKKMGGAEIRTIVGPDSPVRHHTPILYHDIRLGAGGRYGVALPASFRGFLYVYAGEMMVSQAYLRAREALMVGKGERVGVSSQEGARFIVVGGEPYGAPPVIRGSFVE